MTSSCPGAACEQAPWSAARFNRFLRGDFWGARQAENYYLLPQGNQIQDQVVSGGDFFTAGGLVGLTRASRLREPATLLFIGDQPPLSLSRLTPVAGRLPPSGNVDTSRSPSAREPRDIAWPPTGDPALAPRFPVAQVLAANAPAPNLAELNPLAESPRLLSTAEAEQIVRDVQRRSGEQVMAALGLADRGQGVREVAILQQALRRAMPPETGAPPGPTAKPPYRPAILQISVTALPDRSLAQINQVLIPPSGEIRGWQTRVNERALKQAIQRFQRQLSELAEPEPGGAADQLTALLLKPVLPALQAQGITGLLLSLDRGLQGIPFAALPLATGTLGDRVALTVTPALALTELAPSPHSRPGRTLLAGASVFGNGLAPLPMARQELNQLARLHPDSLVLLDGRFQTRTLLEAALAQPMDILHMATHADFNGQRESAARIYTSDGEFSLADLAKRWRNSSSPAIALFVLNACRTAVGNEERELGIAGLALQAGASSALGNLWYVDDVVTAAFSIQFHRWLHKGLRKDQALQETQRQFRRGDIRVVGDQILVGGEEVLITGLNRGQQLQLAHAISHPYYWAGVVLSGSPW
jgi:CHAT domain-containing protein